MGELHNFIQLDIKDNDRERDKIYTKTKLYNLESRSNFNSYNEFVGCFNTGINKRRMFESVYGFDAKRILNDQGKIHIWSSSFRNMYGKILHGYQREVYGDTAEERLDIRTASKADKFCK